MDFISAMVTSPFICIGWIIIGAIAGALARSLTGASDKPFIQDLILGILGAIIGGFIAGFLMGPNIFRENGLTLVLINLVVATIGAVILIMIRRAVTGRA